MQMDLRGQPPGLSYKLLTSLVVPRPIAWISSRDLIGGLNLAPFSFFNMVGSEPPLVVIGVGNGADGLPKHTARNIAATGEFVANLVTEELLGAMNITAVDFPEGHDEFKAARLEQAVSLVVGVPRVAAARAALECKLHKIERIGKNNLIIAEVVAMYAAEGIVDERMQVHDFTPIGRMGTPSWYARSNDRFELPRIKYSDLK